MRCEHKYDHHAGPHACDRDQHDSPCPYRVQRDAERGASPTETPWVSTQPIRTERMKHNHIFQAKTINGNWDCPACQTINPYHMTIEYAYTEEMRMRREGQAWN